MRVAGQTKLVFSTTGTSVKNSTTNYKHRSSLRVGLMYKNVGDNYQGKNDGKVATETVL